jgi:hypothetical protein
MGKRKALIHSNQNHHNVDSLQPVDDLAFAATFATIPSIATETIDTNTCSITSVDARNTDSNDNKPEGNGMEIVAEKEPLTIDGKNGEECNSESIEIISNIKATFVARNDDNDDDDDDDDSDDESDVDLTKELMQMQQEEDDNEKGQNQRNKGKNNRKGSSCENTNAKVQRNILKTQNEVDLYNCPVEDLKKLDILDLDINIKNENNTATTNGDVPNADKDKNMRTDATGTGVVSPANNQVDNHVTNTNTSANKNNIDKRNIVAFQHLNNEYGIMNATIPMNKLMKVRTYA